MVNPFKEVNWKPEDLELRKFGISMLIGFSILAAVTFISGIGKGINLYQFLIVSGFVCFVSSFFIKQLARILYVFIYFFSCSAGIVIGNLLLIFFYYTFFTPIALVVRLSTGRDPLQVKEPKRDSNWNKYDEHIDLSRYYKQY